jgi:hypothetical protein
MVNVTHPTLEYLLNNRRVRRAHHGAYDAPYIFELFTKEIS